MIYARFRRVPGWFAHRQQPWINAIGPGRKICVINVSGSGRTRCIAPPNPQFDEFRGVAKSEAVAIGKAPDQFRRGGLALPIPLDLSRRGKKGPDDPSAISWRPLRARTLRRFDARAQIFLRAHGLRGCWLRILADPTGYGREFEQAKRGGTGAEKIYRRSGWPAGGMQ